MDLKLDRADKFVSSTGRLSNAAMSDHVVGRKTTFLGGGHIGIAFAYCKTQQPALITVASMRPCVLPELSAGPRQRCVMR
jgi:hypothetical protein